MNRYWNTNYGVGDLRPQKGVNMSIQEQIRAKAAEYRDYTAQNLSKLVQTKSYSSQEEDEIGRAHV